MPDVIVKPSGPTMLTLIGDVTAPRRTGEQRAGWPRMLLGDVDIPDKILTAHEEGRLVLFTGAGTSYAAPSGLPTFLQLATGIVNTTNTPLEKGIGEWETRLDVLLGQLDDDPAKDVHELTKAAVTPHGSAPNILHKSLLRIAAQWTPRLVTTNYDLHLEGAAHQLDLALDTYRGPALPLGDSFGGIVYLHGAANGPAQQLIVTDRDFGRAYLRDAWAARFLERMFSNYTVLFVGYSHTDVAMKYLGLALGRNTSRYVLTDKPDDALWRRLDITPIPYSPANDHEQLAQCLSAWAELSGMGLLDHKNRIQSIASQPAEPTPSELSYLVESLRRPDRVGFFTHAASDVYWLGWAANQQPFQLLFEQSPTTSAASEATYLLARWFADRFALNEAQSKAAWSVLTRLGGRLSLPLWNALAAALHSAQHKSDKPRPPHHRRWLQLLLDQRQPGCSTQLLEYALVGSQWPDDRTEILELFSSLTSPEAKVAPGYGLLAPAFEIRPLGSAYWLGQSWALKLAPHLDEIAIEVLTLLERTLTHHYRLYDSLVGTSHDPFSSQRAAIATDDPDPHNPLDILVDATRECLIHLTVAQPQLASATINRWLTSPHGLLRRLAVHAVGERGDLSPDEKLQHVLDAKLVADLSSYPELGALISSAPAGQASAELVDLIVAAAQAALTEDVAPPYSIYFLLDGLRQAGAATENLTAAIEIILAEHPFFENEQPQFGLSFGFVEPQPPMATANFHDRVTADTQGAVDFLLGYSDVHFPKHGKSIWEDAIALLADLVRNHPDDGFKVWPHVSENRQLRDAVIKAWAYSPGDERQQHVVEVLRALPLADHLAALGQFFATIVREQLPGWHDLPGTATLISDVWAAAPVGTHPANDWITDVINDPIGHLVDFWLDGVRQNWSASGDTWTGLGDTDVAFASAMLADTTPKGTIALTQLAGRLHFLDAADSNWCRNNLLPRRDWATPSVAEAFWWGVLSFARWNSGLLTAGLLDGLIDTAKELERFGSDQQRRWADLTASIAMQAELPDSLAWVRALTTAASEPHRVDWIDSVTWLLPDLPTEARLAAWEHWIEDYWTGRVNNMPIVLSLPEASAIAAWIPHLPADFLEPAVNLATSKPASLGEHGDLVDALPADLVTAHPQAIGKLLTHLMTNTEASFWGQHTLLPVLIQLVQQPGDWKSLREAALHLGITLD